MINIFLIFISRSWKERIVVQCIKNNIAVFSPHTSWDAVENGVNDWLANALPIKLCEPITKNLSNPKTGAGRFCELALNITLEVAIKNIKEHIGVPNLQLALAKDKTKCKLFAYC